MKAAAEYQLFPCPDDPGAWTLACWEAYDAASKVDLHASAVALPDGRLFFVDPIPLAPEAMEELLAEIPARPAGILLTNGNHARASDAFRHRFQVPLWAQDAAAREGGLTPDEVIPPEGGPVGGGAFAAIALPGAAAGEVAFHHPGGGGLLIVGDALINLASHPFMPLPDKYCENPKKFRRALEVLLEKEFAVLAFAHGQPATMNPRARLAALLR